MASTWRNTALLFLFIFIFKPSSAIVVQFENSTRSNVDLISGLQNALVAEQQQIPTKTSSGVVAIAEKDIAKIQLILKSLNEPTGCLGQRCSYQDWSTYMKPAITGVITGDRVKAGEAYKNFARAVIANPELGQKVCLSQSVALQCESVEERCECLYLEELKVSNTECSGVRTVITAGLILFAFFVNSSAIF